MKYEIIRKPNCVEIRLACSEFYMSSLTIYMKAQFKGHNVKKVGDSIIIEDEARKEGTEVIFKKVQTVMSKRPKKFLIFYVKVPTVVKRIPHLN